MSIIKCATCVYEWSCNWEGSDTCTKYKKDYDQSGTDKKHAEHEKQTIKEEI